MKKLIYILVYFIFVSKSNAQLNPAVADSLLNFIKANPKRSAIFIQRNDTTIAKLNEDKLMPLASSMKILVALEFAKQAGAGIFSEGKNIPLSELNKYYLPNTDGDAHPQWIEYEKDKGNIKNDSIKLIDVARGMIMFSSNANTEFLIDMLGIDNVNSNRRSLNLQKHTAIFPIVSSLFMYQNPFKKKEKEVLNGIKDLDEETYCKVIYGIHYHLKNDSSFKPKFRPQDLSMPMQKLWSDRLTASTTKEYVQLVKQLNNRKLYDENTYGILADVLEFPMENPAFQKTFTHYGVKGGSTATVLTHVIYLTTKSGNKMELAIFFNNLTQKENDNLQRWLDPFEAQIIFDKAYRGKLGLN